jgi:hypothetical protein
MYGVRILNIAERSKAHDWHLYEVATEVEKDVEKESPVYVGYLHQVLLERKKSRMGRLKWIKDLWPVADDEEDHLIKQAYAIGDVLTLKPQCKLSERMSQRIKQEHIPKDCLNDARRITVCLAFEDGKLAKKLISQ